MKDIKFKAWDKISNTMCDVVEIHQSWIAIPFMDEDGGHLEQRQLKDVELIQYTGWKDKNGVEIYGKDILKWHGAIGYEDGTASVLWNQERGAWYMENDKDDVYDYLDNVYEWSEVIGNIHDNPELMEGKQ